MLSFQDIVDIIAFVFMLVFIIICVILAYRLSKKKCDSKLRDIEYLRTLSIQEVNLVAKFSKTRNPAAEQVLEEKLAELNKS